MIMELAALPDAATERRRAAKWFRARGFFVRRAGTVILGISIVLWFLANYPKAPPRRRGRSSSPKVSRARGATALEPVIKPLGFGLAHRHQLISSVRAREVFVSSTAEVFGDRPFFRRQERRRHPLRAVLREAHWPDGRVLFTPLVWPFG